VRVLAPAESFAVLNCEGLSESSLHSTISSGVAIPSCVAIPLIFNFFVESSMLCWQEMRFFFGLRWCIVRVRAKDGRGEAEVSQWTLG